MCLELPVLSLIEVLICELKTSLSSLFFQRPRAAIALAKGQAVFVL